MRARGSIRLCRRMREKGGAGRLGRRRRSRIMEGNREPCVCQLEV